jgi:hypothetical protein
MEVSYHNSTHETGRELENRIMKSSSQDAPVLNLFLANPTKEYTALEVAAELSHIMIEGSAKRACSNLKKRGLIEKTDTKRTSKYKAPNYTYKLCL